MLNEVITLRTYENFNIGKKDENKVKFPTFLLEFKRHKMIFTQKIFGSLFGILEDRTATVSKNFVVLPYYYNMSTRRTTSNYKHRLEVRHQY